MKSIVGASLLILLFAAVCVRGKRVIRAAEDAEKTGLHIVKFYSETSNEIFERTRETARMLSDDPTVYVENTGVYKFLAMKFTEDTLDEVCSYCAYMQCTRRRLSVHTVLPEIFAEQNFRG